MEDMQATTLAPMDMEIMRMKAKKEVEAAHKMEVEEKNSIIDKLAADRDELKRHFEFIKTKHESLKFESEKEVSNLKSKHKDEV